MEKTLQEIYIEILDEIGYSNDESQRELFLTKLRLALIQ